MLFFNTETDEKQVNFNSRMKLLLISIFGLFITFSGFSQSLIINEVSQGPTGSKEYVEFLVIPSATTQNCTTCADLRGWIIDDNSGYFSNGVTSGTGVAAGACRFSNDAFWSCIPFGTLIVIYNNADVNTALPAQDISMSDNNCRLIIPVNSNLLESQSVSPGATGTTYPTTGWVAGGSLWSPLGMSNSDDSFQTYSPTNTLVPVSGVSWGNNDSNNIIYFTGPASNSVYYFANTTSNDASLQANWIAGTCATPDNQTPGLPNNVANATYISQLNNACTPILPITSTSSINPETCSCNGSVSITPSGSIPGYTYSWTNSSNTVIGQGATISNLCAGTYSCHVESSIGCAYDTTVVVASNIGTTTPTFAQVGPYCLGTTFSLPTTSSNGIVGTWSPAVDNTQTTTYTFTPTNSNCATNTTMTVQISSATTPHFNALNPICVNGNAPSLPSSSIEGITGSWFPTTISTATVGNFNYTFTPSASFSCASIVSINVTITSQLTPNFAALGPYCINTTPTLPAQSTQGISGTWNPSTVNTSSVGTSNYVFTPSSGFCATSYTASISVGSSSVNGGNDISICEGQSVTLTATGTGPFTWNNNVTNGVAFTPTQTATYSVSASSGGCTATDNVTVTVSNYPTADFTFTPTSGLAPLLVTFNNQSQGNANYIWNFGNGVVQNSATTADVTTTYAAGGVYTTTLIANNNGCIDSISYSITVFENGPIEIPNVFSPNDDTVNDVYSLNLTSAKAVNAIILNRWGNVVYQITQVNQTWDGKSNGIECSEGVYFLNYEITDITDTIVKGQQFIHLVR